MDTTLHYASFLEGMAMALKPEAASADYLRQAALTLRAQADWVPPSHPQQPPPLTPLVDGGDHQDDNRPKPEQLP